jgi:hypothetical protein
LIQVRQFDYVTARDRSFRKVCFPPLIGFHVLVGRESMPPG